MIHDYILNEIRKYRGGGRQPPVELDASYFTLLAMNEAGAAYVERMNRELWSRFGRGEPIKE